MSRVLVFTIGLALLGFGCSAPHDNPLDPHSSHYRLPPSSDELELSAQVYSLHRSRLSIETWSVIAHLGGPDVPRLDSSWVSFDARPRLPLSETPDEVWSTVLQASPTNLGTFIGQPFVFTARDSAAAVVYTVGPAYLFRWLENLPIIIQPDSNQLTGAHPMLTWEPYGSTFPITYSAFMLQDPGSADTIWQATIPAGVTTLTVPDSLPDGAYRWTLIVSDAFQNSCSKEAAFNVSSAVPSERPRAPVYHASSPAP